jgi:hypothetical protein
MSLIIVYNPRSVLWNNFYDFTAKKQLKEDYRQFGDLEEKQRSLL